MKRLSKTLRNSKSLNLLNLEIEGRNQNPHGLQILREGLKQINHLQKFKITAIETSFSQEIHPFPFFLKPMKNLTTLELPFPSTNGFLSMEKLRKFMPGLKNLKQLICLSLDFADVYNFTVSGILSISKGLKKCQYLQSLTLSFGACDHVPLETVHYLASCINALQHLSSLALDLGYHQSLNSTSIDLLFNAFRSTGHLKSLAFTFPTYQNAKDGASLFLQKLVEFHPLISLNLDFSIIQNHTEEDFFKNLSHALQAQSQLQILRIKIMHAKIEGPWAKHLAEGFKSL